MKVYFTFTRPRLAMICAVLLVGLLFWGRYGTVRADEKNGDTHAKRMSFWSSIGCTVDENSCTVKEFTVPKDFPPVYQEYNKLQKKAGYDLSPYSGCTVTQYSYKVK